MLRWVDARWLWCGRIRDAGTRGVGGGVGRSSPSMAFMRSSAAGRIVRWFVLVFGAKCGCQLVRFGWLARDNSAYLGQNLQLCIGWQLVDPGTIGTTAAPRGAPTGAPLRPQPSDPGTLWDDGSAAWGPHRGPAAAAAL